MNFTPLWTAALNAFSNFIIVDEHCRIADDATKPQITRASAAALQPNQAILAWSARCISHKYV